MLANIIGAVIMLLVGLAIFGTLSQEIDNVINCNMSNATYESPLGSTDSFGGGGSGHFGGYDGTVKKSWGSNLAPYKTNSTLFNKDCEPLTGSARTVLSIMPFLFVVVVLGVGLGTVFSSLNRSGLV